MIAGWECAADDIHISVIDLPGDHFHTSGDSFSQVFACRDRADQDHDFNHIRRAARMIVIEKNNNRLFGGAVAVIFVLSYSTRRYPNRIGISVDRRN